MVKLARQLDRGDRGPDVEAVKRGLSRAGYMGPLAKLMGKPVAVRRLYGPFTVRAVKRFQAAHGLKADGTYGPKTHVKLARFFDRYAESLMAKAPKPDADDSVRARVVARGMQYHRRRNRIAYSQSRPTQLAAPENTSRLDCSGLVAACMHFAGVRPDVDWRYTNTWVQIKLGRSVSLEHAEPGDVVFYGTSVSNPTHEALYLGNGRVLSMGHYPMGIYPVDYRRDLVAIRDLIGDAA